MRRYMCLLIVLGMTALAGSAHGQPEESGKVRTVQVRLVEGSASSGAIEIDTSYHETAVLFQGDRVAWACECPPGTEFTIDEPYLLVDLDELEDALTPGQSDKLIQSVRAGEKLLPLFGDWRPMRTDGQRWYDGSESIVSPALAPTAVAHGMWKYTWRVRLKGDAGSEVVWDPHILTHPGPSDP